MRLFCFTQDEAKCPGCGWSTTKFYVLADNLKEARAVLNQGEALCAECMAELLCEEAYSITADKIEQRPIFAINREDVQEVARGIASRELTEEEPRHIKKGVEFGLQCWAEVCVS